MSRTWKYKSQFSCSHQCRTLMYLCGRGDGAIMDDSIIFLSLSAMWGHSKKKTICKPRREFSPGTRSASTLILTCPVFRTVRQKHLLLKPRSLWGFVMAAWAKTVIYMNSFSRYFLSISRSRYCCGQSNDKADEVLPSWWDLDSSGELYHQQ